MFTNIAIYVQDPLPENIDLNSVLQTVENSLPQKFLEETGVEMIMIGAFEELKQREIQSVWKSEEGTIMITNEQSSNDDMIDDLMHEFAHATENRFGFEIYADDHIETEFLQKRRHLHDILRSHDHEYPLEKFMSVAYDSEFDNFLYKEVGYERLTFYTMGLFVTPYAATSAREYFATAFEEFFLPNGDRASVKAISPAAYQKIEQLSEY